MTTFQLYAENFSPEAIRATPAGVMTLVISSLDEPDSMPLFEKTGEELAIGFSVIPASVTTLDLSSNDLTHLYGDLAQAFAAIPIWVKKLILAGNGLCNFHVGGELATVLAAISAGITILDLASNHLHYMQAAKLAQSLAAIPTGITVLNLSNNGLGNKDPADFVQILAAIPAGITELNLSGNDLGNKTAAELVQIFAAIPGTVKKIIITDVNRTALENCGLYLNFRAGEFVRHCDLDKAQIRKHALGFTGAVVNGQAQEPLITAFHKYLTSYDLANLGLVCTDKSASSATVKNDTYCGFKPGFLLNRKNGLF